MNKVPIAKTIAYAYSFTFGQLGTIIGLSWIPLVAIAVLQFLPYAVGGDPNAQPANLTEEGRIGLERFASSVLQMLLYAIIYVPVTRQALGLRQGGALFHFSLGPAEFRLFGALILFVLVLMAMAVGIGVLGLVSAGVDAASGKNAALALLLAILIFVAVLGFIYAVLRLAFVLVPVTVAEDHVSLTRSWQLSRGNFWRIFVVMLAVMLPVYLIHLAGLTAIIGPALFAPLPADTSAAQHAIVQRFALIGHHMPEYIGLQLILAPFGIGLAIGASSFGYRALVPSNMVGPTAT
jgi:hypothetical protein